MKISASLAYFCGRRPSEIHRSERLNDDVAASNELLETIQLMST